MPDYGDIRTAQGETRFWNGRGWQKSANQDGPEPTTFAGGFTRHLLEREPAARNALLGGAALMTGGAAVPASAAVPFVGRGMEYLSKLLRGKNPLPSSGAELAGDLGTDALEAATTLYGGPAVAKGAKMVGAAKEAVASRLPSWMQNIAHVSTALNPKALAADTLTSKPVLGAIQDFGEQLTPRGVQKAFGSVAEGMTPGRYASMEALAPSHEDLLAGGARRYTAGRAQQVAAEEGSGLSGLRESVPDVNVTPRATTPAEPVYGGWSPRATHESGPFGFSSDDLHEFQNLTEIGYEPRNAARIVLEGASAPSMDALAGVGRGRTYQSMLDKYAKDTEALQRAKK